MVHMHTPIVEDPCSARLHPCLCLCLCLCPSASVPASVGACVEAPRAAGTEPDGRACAATGQAPGARNARGPPTRKPDISADGPVHTWDAPRATLFISPRPEPSPVTGDCA